MEGRAMKTNKFFSIERRSNTTGEIEDIITSSIYDRQGRVLTFDEIQNEVIAIANYYRCKGSIKNEYGSTVLDYNYSEYCENNICFAWEDEKRLDEFIANHPNVPTNGEIEEAYNEEAYHEFTASGGCRD